MRLRNNLTLIQSLGIVKAVRFIFRRKHLNAVSFDKKAKAQIAEQLGIGKEYRHQESLIFAKFASVFAIAGIIVIAQWAKPGQTLYTVKQGTDEVRSVVQPGFRKELKTLNTIETSNSKEVEQKSSKSEKNSEDSKEKSPNDGTSIKSGSGTSSQPGSGSSGTSGTSGSSGTSGTSSSGSGTSGSGRHHSGDDDIEVRF